MTLNLETDLLEQAALLDETLWSALQAEVCVSVATAKYHAFIAEASRIAEFARLGFVSRKTASDYLHVAAIYNQLYAEYGRDRMQAIMAEAFEATA